MRTPIILSESLKQLSGLHRISTGGWQENKNKSLVLLLSVWLVDVHKENR